MIPDNKQSCQHFTGYFWMSNIFAPQPKKVSCLVCVCMLPKIEEEHIFVNTKTFEPQDGIPGLFQNFLNTKKLHSFPMIGLYSAFSNIFQWEIYILVYIQPMNENILITTSLWSCIIGLNRHKTQPMITMKQNQIIANGILCFF